jgi:hypothetical protein
MGWAAFVWSQSPAERHNNPTKSEMIIFIHGSMQPPEWRFSDLIKVLRDKIENTIYLLASDYLRKDSFFGEGQAMQQEGLIPIDMQDRTNASSMVAGMCEMQYQWQGSTAQRLYYTFGWKGIIHLYTRYEEAKNLMSQLCAELKRLNAQGIYPKIKIVTYSHGGNVALNLAAVKDDDPMVMTEPFEIDELVMFATPVQKATDYLVASKMFKKVYHFYSYNDGIQTLDFTCPKQFFSNRMFKKRKDFAPPKSLVQIRMRTTKTLNSRYKKDLNHSMDYTFLHDKRFKHKYHDPKHTEFWCFQWGSSTYRDLFTLAPLPIVVFYPSMIATLQQKFPDWHDIIFDYAPFYEGAIVKNRKTKKSFVVKMLSNDQLDAMYALARASGRTTLDIYEQKSHLRDAVERAQNDYESLHPDHLSKHKIMQLAWLIR